MTPFANMLERALWTGLQTGIAVLTADGLGWYSSEAWQTAAVAGIAAALSAFKTIAQERMAYLDGNR